MTRLAIIADDLTGALDASSPFAMRGLHTVVATAPSAVPEALAGRPSVIGVSTNSREMPAAAAREAVADCIARLPAGVRLFKKIDSRLKGNIESELDAISYDFALVVAAIPAFGRSMRNGLLLGFGVDQPIDIRSRLGVHARRSMVPDVTTQADIEAAVARADADLYVGARALGEALAGRMAPERALIPVAVSKEGPLLGIIGSTDPITLAQVAHVRRAYPDLTYVEAADGMVVARDSLNGKCDALVQAAESPETTDPVAVADRLGRLAASMIAVSGTHLILSGGATAKAVLEHLDVRTVTVAGEVLPGLPVARAGAFTIITKSGGFGAADTLTRLFGRLHGTGEKDDACPTG